MRQRRAVAALLKVNAAQGNKHLHQGCVKLVCSLDYLPGLTSAEYEREHLLIINSINGLRGPHGDVH